MPKNLFERYNITNVHQENVDDTCVHIHFDLDGVPSTLIVFQTEGFFRPYYVVHDQQTPCSLCGSNAVCEPLENLIYSLFEQFIQLPDIQPHWVSDEYKTSEFHVTLDSAYIDNLVLSDIEKDQDCITFNIDSFQYMIVLDEDNQVYHLEERSCLYCESPYLCKSLNPHKGRLYRRLIDLLDEA